MLKKLPQTLEDYYLDQCLSLAQRAYGQTSPNPMVGAVVLDAQGRKVGEGFHARAGDPHAEVMALEMALRRGSDAARGGTLFVNLEPCCHTGRTPPCTERIIEAGIERVVCGTLDPNPRVAGHGRDALQNARISVRYGFLEKECRRLNDVFFKHITTHESFVTLKLAMTMNGKIATRSGRGEWLTSEFSRHAVHHLRQGHDAILTTASTVLADNPLLTVRDGFLQGPPPVRVILDRALRLDPSAFQIFDPGDAPVWVITSQRQEDAQGKIIRALKARGAEVLSVPETWQGLDLEAVFKLLHQKGLTSVMVESGGKLAGSLMQQERVDKLVLFYSPRVLADHAALEAFQGDITLSLAEAPPLEVLNTQRLEGDLMVEARPIPQRKEAPPDTLVLGSLAKEPGLDMPAAPKVEVVF